MNHHNITEMNEILMGCILQEFNIPSVACNDVYDRYYSEPSTYKSLLLVCVE